MRGGYARGAPGFISMLSFIMSTLYGVPSWPTSVTLSQRERSVASGRRVSLLHQIIKSHFTRSLQTTQHSPSTCGYVRQILDSPPQVFYVSVTGHRLGRSKFYSHLKNRYTSRSCPHPNHLSWPKDLGQHCSSPSILLLNICKPYQASLYVSSLL